MKIQRRKHKRVGMFTSLGSARGELKNLNGKGYLIMNEAAKKLLTPEDVASMENDFQVEKGIPLPSTTPPVKFPFDRMEVGESFTFPYDLATRVSANAHNYAKKNGGRFTIRKVSDTEGRCWRAE